MERLRQTRYRPYRRGGGPAFSLTTYETGKQDSLGKEILHYIFKEGREVIFEGEDFACSPLSPIDSRDTHRALMGFLTARPWDTDASYFADYTPRQLAWRDAHAEAVEGCLY
jgi:hypothetical protein